MVFVLDQRKRPITPTTPKRARLMLAGGRAVVHRVKPFTIRLRDRRVEHSVLQPVALKLILAAVPPGWRSHASSPRRRERCSTRSSCRKSGIGARQCVWRNRSKPVPVVAGDRPTCDIVPHLSSIAAEHLVGSPLDPLPGRQCGELDGSLSPLGTCEPN